MQAIRAINMAGSSSTWQMTVWAGSTAGSTPSSGYREGPNTGSSSVQFNEPSGGCVTVAGDVLIADAFNGRIRRLRSGQTSQTVVGGFLDGPVDSATLANPEGIAIAPTGEIYLAGEPLEPAMWLKERALCL